MIRPAHGKAGIPGISAAGPRNALALEAMVLGLVGLAFSLTTAVMALAIVSGSLALVLGVVCLVGTPPRALGAVGPAVARLALGGACLALGIGKLVA